MLVYVYNLLHLNENARTIPKGVLQFFFQTESMNQWKPFVSMVCIGFAFAVVNILLKEVLNRGLNHLVFITYRLGISAVFLAPISYYLERYNFIIICEYPMFFSVNIFNHMLAQKPLVVVDL